ncbi:hypothetical protein FOYG_02752 [Fusarium oxysporum NRRL 32931]|uniref:Uncharacterized protein n=1 Tax=Fusarium oxysporum NRRL 32931 TaxID=660029 RepID=W9IXP6_FUSOX|nr:hypothetical protein FOYG_02752 [Fusarium oxysporum NRRL 32931]
MAELKIMSRVCVRERKAAHWAKSRDKAPQDAESEGPRKTREETGTSRGNEKAGVGDESVVQHLEQLECGGDEFIERV